MPRAAIQCVAGDAQQPILRPLIVVTRHPDDRPTVGRHPRLGQHIWQAERSAPSQAASPLMHPSALFVHRHNSLFVSRYDVAGGPVFYPHSFGEVIYDMAGLFVG